MAFAAAMRCIPGACRRGGRGLDGPQQGRWLARLDGERDNLRAALGWGLAHDPAVAQGLATSLWRYWLARGALAEGRQSLHHTLAARPGDGAVGTQAALLTGAAMLALEQGAQAHADGRAQSTDRPLHAVVGTDPASAERRLATLHQGDYFGEVARFADVARTATVRALTPVVVDSLTRVDLLRELALHPGLRQAIEPTIALRTGAPPPQPGAPTLEPLAA